MRSFRIICLLVWLIWIVSACATSANPTLTPTSAPFTRLTPARVDAPISPAEGTVILTIRGAIGTSNVAGEAAMVEFSFSMLEALGMVEYNVEDKQGLARLATFKGVLLSDLLAAVKMSGTATKLKATAVDDYSVEIPISDVRNYPVLVALYADNQTMPLDRFGPTRIIYPYHVFALDASIYDPRWIWSLKEITVE